MIEEKLPTIGLSIIVKNEEKVIGRLLNSIYKIIDYYTIVDTGSTDNTKQVIQDFFDEKKIPGQIYDRGWNDYSSARNYAMMQAKYKTDFCFTIDADEILTISQNFSVQELKKKLSEVDCGYIEMYYANMLYSRRAFWKNSKQFYYKFPVHELLLCNDEIKHGVLDNISVNIINDGATHRQNPKEKYLGHAKLLHDYIEENGLEPRCVFYLAQSYKDAGELKKAMQWYEIRTTMHEGFNEEIYYSRLMIGILKWRMSYPIMEIADEFMKCCELDYFRAEHLYELKLMYEENGRERAAIIIDELLSGYKNPYPVRQLFINPEAYKKV